MIGKGAMAIALCTTALAGAAPTAAAPAANGGADPNKVLRYAFEVAETSFDPQKLSLIHI